MLSYRLHGPCILDGPQHFGVHLPVVQLLAAQSLGLAAAHAYLSLTAAPAQRTPWPQVPLACAKVKSRTAAVLMWGPTCSPRGASYT
jgi:hypothetical protein